jgi:hypothetical protein
MIPIGHLPQKLGSPKRSEQVAAEDRPQRMSEEIAPVLSGKSTRIGWGLLIHTAESGPQRSPKWRELRRRHFFQPMTNEWAW